jgi:DNA-binding NarL/FixJ family response regulator
VPRLRVLFVDDSEAFLQGARTRLERQSVEVLAAARNTAEALRLAPQSRPDVVLVDVMLADESGLELTRRLHEQEGPGCPPVILISTHDEDDLADLLAGSLAVGFLTKADLCAEAIRRILADASAEET